MRKYIVLFIIIFAAAFAFYWSVFRYGLSTNSADWGSFGGYFSGLVLPILTAINIVVFVKMTKEISLIDGKRATTAINAQKEITLMQFRKKEIDTFENYIYNAMYPAPTSIKSKKAFAMPIGMASLYLGTFLESKLSLFSLSEDSETTIAIRELYEKIVKYHVKFIGPEEIDTNDWAGILELHERIIRDLQIITIGNTSNHNMKSLIKQSSCNQ